MHFQLRLGQLSVIACLSLAGSRTLAQSLPSDFDAYVQRAMTEFKVPGLSVAVVKDGKVLLAKGYGTSQLGTNKPVTGDTLFGIASNSKLFTATALAILVDQGKIAWDDPVQKYLPEFALSDPYVSHEITIRDLLVHRSGLGLGAGDLLWWPHSTFSSEEIVNRLRYIPLATSFRSSFAYDNVLYLVAGKLIQKVTGQPWKQYVADRILKRVGMTHSTTTYAAAAKSGDVSHVHAIIDGKLKVIEPFTDEVTGPAGSIMSSANDMAKWLLTQLGRGKTPSGSQLYSAQRSSDLWNLVTPIPLVSSVAVEPFKSIQPDGYGYALGLFVRDYRGHHMLTHTGGLPGYLSWVSMFPNEHFGIVVLTNQESGNAFMSIAYRLQDWLLNSPYVDWISAFSRRAASQKSALAAASPEKKRNLASHPSLPLSAYAGTYRDRWYGDISVTWDGKKLTMQFAHTPSLVGEMEPWQYDTFVVRWKDRTIRGDAFVTFSLTADGTIDSAKMAPYDGSVDFSFDYRDLLLQPVQR